MRILEICTRFPAGGIQRHVLDLSTALRQRGHKVYIAGAPGPWLDESKDPDFLPLPLGRVAKEGGSVPRRLSAAFGCAGKLREFLKRNPVDIIHAHETAPALVARLATLGTKTPVALTFHGAEPERVPEFARIARMTARHVLTPSHASAQELAAAGGPAAGKIKVIGIGIQPTPPQDPARIAELRGRLLGGRQKLVLTIARLSHQKGIDILVQLVRRATAVRDDIKFVVVGDGPQAEQAVAWAKEAGIYDHIVFAGRSDEPHLYLAAADLFLLPSRWESLPITIVEAFRHGLPVIATDTGGVKELVNDDVGRVANVGDVDALTGFCLNILGDDRLRSDLSARATALSHESRFDPSHINQAMEDFYRGILAEADPR